VSETILDHGYVPEEHAPDPVMGHGDPTRPGKIGIWLFLASEIMFFIGILGTYIILRSGSPELFATHAHVLSKAWAGLNTLVLILSSLTVALAVDAAQKGNRTRTAAMLALTIVSPPASWSSSTSSTPTSSATPSDTATATRRSSTPRASRRSSTTATSTPTAPTR